MQDGSQPDFAENTRNQARRPGPGAGPGGASGNTIYPEYYHNSPTKGPLDTDLNLLLRRRMSALIGKFIDAIMDEDSRVDNKSQMKLKMHAIVNRKCQNLLTTIFGGERAKFQKLLMVKVESTKDARSVDEAFDRYENLKSEGIDQSNDKKINDFLKGILKVNSNINQD